MTIVRRPADWIGLGFDTWLLALEATQVVWLRSWVILLGGARADREARRMVEEKVAAQAAFGWLVATGAAGREPETVGRAAVRHYRKRVRNNARRLARR